MLFQPPCFFTSTNKIPLTVQLSIFKIYFMPLTLLEIKITTACIHISISFETSQCGNFRLYLQNVSSEACSIEACYLPCSITGNTLFKILPLLVTTGFNIVLHLPCILYPWFDLNKYYILTKHFFKVLSKVNISLEKTYFPLL